MVCLYTIIVVALLSITACGTGLNLTRANVVLFAELVLAFFSLYHLPKLHFIETIYMLDLERGKYATSRGSNSSDKARF